VGPGYRDGVGTVVAAGLLPEGAFTSLAEDVAQVIELVGIAILVVGGVGTAVAAARNALAGRAVYENVRRSFGRVLLLSLEVLVAADIVQTVAVDLTLETVGTLALLVLVRTVLSLSLAAEIDGVVPWRRAELQRSVATPRPSTAAPDGP
jgi:uncharacterized membrane protein